MALKDKIQARIGWLQLLFSLGIGVILALLGWLATAINPSAILRIGAAVIAILLGVGAASLATFIIEDINKLEGL